MSLSKTAKTLIIVGVGGAAVGITYSASAKLRTFVKSNWRLGAAAKSVENKFPSIIASAALQGGDWKDTALARLRVVWSEETEGLDRKDMTYKRVTEALFKRFHVMLDHYK